MDNDKDWLGRGFAFPIAVDPTTGGIAASEYDKDVEEAIRIILETARGERVMRPDFGCGIHDLVFEVIDRATLTLVETNVREALTKYEARIEVLKITANPIDAEMGQLLIELEYRIRTTNQLGNLVYPFYFRESGVALAAGSRG